MIGLYLPWDVPVSEVSRDRMSAAKKMMDEINRDKLKPTPKERL
jgi:hypothetical protein